MASIGASDFIRAHNVLYTFVVTNGMSRNGRKFAERYPPTTTTF